MSATQAIRRPWEKRNPMAAGIGGFAQSSSIAFPGTTNNTGSGVFNANYQISGSVYDDRPASPTYQQYIFVTFTEPVLYQSYSGLSVNFTAPTVTLTLQPGCTKHQIFAYLDFGAANFASLMLNTPVGLTGTYNSPNVLYSGWQPSTVAAFAGTVSGVITCWAGGSAVGKLPFVNTTASTVRSGASVVFNTWQNTGLVVSGKGGGLQVVAPFDGTSRQIPAIEINGLIDSITVDLTANYQNASSPGGFYVGVLSTP